MPVSTKAKQIVHMLSKFLPAFQEHMESGRSLFRSEAGNVSVTGVFLELAEYTRDHWEGISEPQRIGLFEYLEWKIEDPVAEVGEAVMYGFIESISDDRRVTSYLQPKCDAFNRANPFGAGGKGRKRRRNGHGA